MKRFRPERIIFCIDLDADMGKEDFCQRKDGPIRAIRNKLSFIGDNTQSPDPDVITRFALVTQNISTFCQAKERMCDKHEYAIMGLRHEGIWLQDFSSSNDVVCKTLGQLSVSEKSYGSLDLTTVFECLKKNIGYHYENSSYTYRCIFLYGRRAIPTFEGSVVAKMELCSADNFVFDAIFLHGKKSALENPQTVFDVIIDCESSKERSHIYEVASSRARLAQYFVTLLAASSQRPNQFNVEFKPHTTGV